MSAHSTIGPSSAERWWRCPGSVALTATLPNPTSKFAAEGTLAHTLSEDLVTGKTDSLKLYARVGESVKVEGFDIEITEEMVGAAEAYRDIVAEILASIQSRRRPAPIVAKTEVKLDGKAIDPRLFGTADWLGYQKGNALHVVDLKYGKGVVDVEDNKQLKTYAVMAMDSEAGWAFDDVFVHIFQPRARHEEGTHRTVRFSTTELVEFRKELVAAVKETARAGAPLVAGSWCRSSFCPAMRAGCPALHGALVKEAQVDFAKVPPTPAALPSVEMLPIGQLARALEWKDLFEAYFKAAEERAQRELEAGRQVPGYKLVAGRSNRAWRDEAEVVAKFEPVLGEKVYEEPKVKSPSQLEKLVGKKAGVEELTYKPEAPLRLAKDSDPRTSASPAEAAAKAFAPVIEVIDTSPGADNSLPVKIRHLGGLESPVVVEPLTLEEELGLAPKVTAARSIWP